MTISSDTVRMNYTGNGVATVFAFPFKVFAATDIDVYINGALTSGSLYSVSGIGADGGGAVTFASAPANAATVELISSVDYTQPTDFKNQGIFYAQRHESAYDRATAQIAQLSDRGNHALRMPLVEGQVAELPAAAARANQVLGFDASGNPSLLQANPALPQYFTPSIAGAIAVLVSTLFSDQAINLRNMGCACDAKAIAGGINSGSTTFTASSAVFTPAHNGKKLAVRGAGVGGATLWATATYVSSTQVSLSVSASTTVSNVQCYIGTDDTAAYSAAISNVLGGNGSYFIPGFLLINGAMPFPLLTGFVVKGRGRYVTGIIQAADNTPIHRFTKELAHGFKFQDLYMGYVTPQGMANSTANAFYIDCDSSEVEGVFNWEVESCSFGNCRYVVASNGSSTISTTGSFASAASSVNVASAAGIQMGMKVSGSGIAAGTSVVSVSGNTVTISANTTASGSNTALSFVGTQVGWGINFKGNNFLEGGVSGGWFELIGMAGQPRISFDNLYGLADAAMVGPVIALGAATLVGRQFEMNAGSNYMMTNFIGGCTVRIEQLLWEAVNIRDGAIRTPTAGNQKTLNHWTDSVVDIGDMQCALGTLDMTSSTTGPQIFAFISSGGAGSRARIGTHFCDAANKVNGTLLAVLNGGGVNSTVDFDEVGLGISSGGVTIGLTDNSGTVSGVGIAIEGWSRRSVQSGDQSANATVTVPIGVNDCYEYLYTTTFTTANKVVFPVDTLTSLNMHTGFRRRITRRAATPGSGTITCYYSDGTTPIPGASIGANANGSIEIGWVRPLNGSTHGFYVSSIST